MKTVRIPAEKLTIHKDKTIMDGLDLMTKAGNKKQHNILLVVDDDKRLLGIINDGDIRRAFLRGFTQQSSVIDALKKMPVVAPERFSQEDIIRIMKINKVDNLPIVDEQGRVLYVEGLIEFNSKNEKQVAIVMAGGDGERLRPLTDTIPKSMLEIGAKPLLQIILETLRNYGYRDIIINIRYLGHIIKDYFKDGSDFKININYVQEPKPLGTAGSLGILPDILKPDKPFLVVNGDLLTTLNFHAFLEFHIAANYDFTLCGRPYEIKVPFGYPVINGDVVTEFKEKPTFKHLVNSGIYCMSPEMIEEVPENEYFDMPDLIRKVISKGKRVGVFPLREKFHEIGRHESYIEAEEFYKKYF